LATTRLRSLSLSQPKRKNIQRKSPSSNQPELREELNKTSPHPREKGLGGWGYTPKLTQSVMTLKEHDNPTPESSQTEQTPISIDKNVQTWNQTEPEYVTAQ